jgi:rod shape determining protein RodA
MAAQSSSRLRFDWFLPVIVLLITITGILNLYSAVQHVPSERELYLTQVYWFAFGIVAAVVVATLDYRIFERNAYVFYIVGIVLLLALFLLPKEVAPVINGSRRWLVFAGGFRVQPSEIMKVLLILALARYINRQPRYAKSLLSDIGIMGLITLLPMLLILKQPDLGTALMLLIIFITTLFLYRMNLSSMLVTLGLMLAVIPFSWSYLFHDYQRQRIISYLNPTADLLGASWHANQSVIAIGSGQLTGKGFMMSSQNRHAFLPAQSTDFPFPVWAEEQGFIGALFLLLLYLALILWALRIASRARDRFAMVVAFGIANIFFWQSILNLGMVSALLPVVGITLPLFSYGGSSILMALLGVGLLLNISMQSSD